MEKRIIKNTKLNAAVDEFVKQMKGRLADKERQGFVGWDDPNDYPNMELINRAFNNLRDINRHQLTLTKEAVDVANYMMMIWFRNQK